jgi:hypothetical protein
MSEIKRLFPALTDSNWRQWADNIQALLSTKELWEYVDGSNPMPAPQDPDKVTTEEKKELLEWKQKAAKAGGGIWLALDDSQKVHVSDVKSDPAGMWKKLEAVHVQKKPSSRFIAYDSLFNIRKEETETLSALMARTDKAMQDIKSLRPSTFTIDDLDKELLCMTLIRALPTEFDHFASSLLLLDTLDLNKLKSAFQNEESQRLARTSAASSSLALKTSTSSLCYFCGRAGHIEKDCRAKVKASADAKAQVKSQSKPQTKGKGKQHQRAKEAVEDSESKVEELNAVKIEFAGNASALPASQRSKWLQTRASTDWNPDTGATSSMTPHRHWFRSYSPHVVPIRLVLPQLRLIAG